MTVVIRDLEFYAYHGVTDQEQFIGHRYKVSLEATVPDERATESDAIADTVHYGELAELTAAQATTTRFRTVEALAGHLIGQIFARFARIEAITIEIVKVSPPVALVVGEVGVSVTRKRSSTAG